MIVRNDDARATQPRRIDNNISHRQSDGGRLSVVGLEVEAASCGVEVGYPQPLTQFAFNRKARRKEMPSGFLAVQNGGGVDALGQHIPNLWLEGVPT